MYFSAGLQLPVYEMYVTKGGYKPSPIDDRSDLT